MLISDVRSDKIRKNAVDWFWISLLVLKTIEFKVEKLVIWRQPSWHANEDDMTSQLQEWSLRTYHFAFKFWNIERNSRNFIVVWLKFSGGQRWWHLQNPLLPTNNFCLYPPSVLRCLWKDPLMTPHHPTSSIFHCYSLHIHHPFPPKNFDHTLDC